VLLLPPAIPFLGSVDAILLKPRFRLRLPSALMPGTDRFGREVTIADEGTTALRHHDATRMTFPMKGGDPTTGARIPSGRFSAQGVSIRGATQCAAADVTEMSSLVAR
jgi:hypothetical protein